MSRKRQNLELQFVAALQFWDNNNHSADYGERTWRAQRAAFACMWFIENVSQDAPERTNIFFRVREIYRQG